MNIAEYCPADLILHALASWPCHEWCAIDPDGSVWVYQKRPSSRYGRWMPTYSTHPRQAAPVQIYKPSPLRKRRNWEKLICKIQ